MEIFKMSLSASVVILAVVIIRALMLHRLPKLTFLALWAVALCRLLIPFSVSSRFSIQTLANKLKTYFFPANETIAGMSRINTGNLAYSINTPLADTAPAGIWPILAVWLIGLSACAIFFIITHLRWRREYKTALPADNEFIRAWQRKQPLRRKVEIRQSDRIASPLTYGIICPVILLPKTTDWTDETCLRYILTHEFMHIRRFDTLMKLLLTAAVCLHWFNPLVWVMYVLVNRDIELSCDEAVVRKFGETVKSAYALTLIGLEEKKSSLVPIVNNFSKSAIEERIVSIMKIKNTSYKSIILAMALVIGISVVFATNAASAADKEHQNGNISFAEETGYLETPESKAEAFAVYKEYGLTYNKNTDRLFYNGELVRYFEDYYPVDEHSSAGMDHFNEAGTIDVHGVRDLAQLTHNSDGAVEPGGRLMGIEPYSQAEFDARNTDELKNPPKTYAVTVDEGSGKNNSAAVPKFSNDSTSPMAYSEEGNVTTDELAKEYAVYKPFGLTYDKKNGCLYYKDKLVRYFTDIMSSNGESFSSGKFKGSMRQINNPDGKGEVDVYAVRDYGKPDADGHGTLTGINQYSQEEFDARTKEQ